MAIAAKSPDRFAHTLGVLGFCISLVSIGWQVYLYRESFAERVALRLSAFHELKQGEEIEAKSILNKSYLYVEVIDVGQHPLYLRQVFLRVPCDLGTDFWSFYGLGLPPQTTRLEPGEVKRLQQEWDYGRFPLTLGDEAKVTKDYCVIVNSTKGEILRSMPPIEEDDYGVIRRVIH
jgi:hypothetical protein